MKDVDPKPLENEILIHTPKIIKVRNKNQKVCEEISSLSMSNKHQNILELGFSNLSSKYVLENPSYGPKDAKDICIISNKKNTQIRSDQSLSRVRLFATP